MSNIKTVPLDELDKKIIESFPDRVVVKAFSIQIADKISAIPRFIIEFLISNHQASDGTLSEDAIREIKADIDKFYPRPSESEKILSQAIELKRVQLIDSYKVFVDLARRKYRTNINTINQTATVDAGLVRPDKYPEMLTTGLWGKAMFQYVSTGDKAQLNMCDFENYQARKVILKKIIDVRSRFTTEEWVNMLVRTVGINPSKLTRRLKLLYLCRLIPLVERRTNALELGPPGTGKSFVYENLSFYSRLILGGDVSLATLIYNKTTRELGLIFSNDLICFDEINKMKAGGEDFIPKLQQIMASGNVERGDMTASTDISLVFQGNLETQMIGGKWVPRYDDHFKPLLKGMKDSAFLDRFHMYIHGWDFDRIKDEAINYQTGLISNFFAEYLHKMRREDYTGDITKTLTIFAVDDHNNDMGISIRDKTALVHIISGLLKLLYPNHVVTRDEWKELVELAIELRKNVLDEINKIEPGMFSRSFQYRFADMTFIDPTKFMVPETVSIQKNLAGPVSPVVTEAISSKPPSSPSPVSSAATPAVASPAATTPSSPHAEIPITETLTSTAEDVAKLDAIAQEQPKSEGFRLYLNKKHYLTRPIPYWVFRTLGGNKALNVKENCCEINLNYLLEGMAVDIEDKVGLVKDLTVHQDFLDEDENLAPSQAKIKELGFILENFREASTPLKIIPSMMDMNNIKDPPLFREIEEITTKMVDPHLDQMHQDADFVSFHRNILLQCGEPVELARFDYIPVMIPRSQMEKEIQTKIKYWKQITEALTNVVVPIRKKANEMFPQMFETKKKLFKGEKFILMGFDLNNLFISFHKRAPNYRPTMVLDHIKKILLKTPYLAHYFVSKQYDTLRTYTDKWGKETNQWHIESNIKLSRKYSDIDQNLTGEICGLLERYRGQILEVVLGSGDKDLHIVADHCKKHNIKLTVFVIEEKNLSHELRELADDVKMMFS